MIPWMYMNTFVMAQRKPMSIASFETLIRPYDGTVWAFYIGCTSMVFMLLIVMQTIWSSVSGKISPKGYMFQGDMILISWVMPHEQ